MKKKQSETKAESGRIKPTKPTPEPVKVKRYGGRRLWLLGLGVLMLVAAITTLAVGDSRNLLVGLLAIGCLGGGAICIYTGLKKQDEGFVVTPTGKVDKKFTANALNIYEDKISFELMVGSALQSQPRLCRNDGKYYHVHIWGTAWEGKEAMLKKFVLPDTQYRDPREFANNLNIPAHRKLAQRRVSLLEQMRPYALVVGMLAVGLVWVLVGG